MLYSYFLAALRNLIKHPLNSAINTLGLSLGLACCIMLLVFISDQLSYDTQFTDHQRIHVLEQVTQSGAYLYRNKRVSLQVVEALRANLPDIQQMATFEPFGIDYINDAGKSVRKWIHYTQGDFFQIFDFPFLEGTSADALQQANDIVLTQSEAKNHFGNEPAFGKTLVLGDQLLRVSGVIGDIPDQTHFKQDRLGIIASVKGKPAPNIPSDLPEHMRQRLAEMNSDRMATVRCYIKLSPGANRSQLNQQISDLASPANQVFSFRMPNEAERMPDMKVNFTLHPVRNSHLGESIGDTGRGMGLFQNWPFIYAAAGLAMAVLLISCVNFINLTTARFSLRNLEIGLRKTLGAKRKQIFSQFICETLALTVLAVMVALVIAYLGLPWFSSMIQIDLTQVGYATPLFFYSLAGLIVLTTLFAGFYPSMVLSRINPVSALGDNNQKMAKSRLRTVLTTLQFVFSIFLITVCFVAYHQISHLKTMDLGYDTENVVNLHTPFQRSTQQAALKELARELQSRPAVESTSVSLSISALNTKYRIRGAATPPIFLNALATDENFFQHYQIKLAAGRAFRYGAVSEQSKINQAGRYEKAGVIILTLGGLYRLGIPSAEEAVGKMLEVPNGDKETSLEIIGVVDAFPKILEPKRRGLFYTPDLIYYGESVDHGVISVRFHEGHRSEGVSYLKQLIEQDRWHPGGLSFPNQKFEPLFQSLDRVLSSVALFAIIAVVVAIMGLYAMSAFVVARRTQEIGVRKVMGAPVVRVMRLLLWDFSKPILIAMAVALPLAYLGVSQVIQYVAARISLEAIVFGVVPVLVTLIALITVSGHTVKAASINPVRALRYE